ncbi:NAD(P)-binding domain-containing protein [Actinoplanes sp. NPDC049596]|uniref:NAD(P)-binding domain-containing protein n=1 Tax=unclassified Actinoplanes TaxID=2626549 RepID=UPI003448A043
MRPTSRSRSPEAGRAIERVTTVVVGAGHAGLAASHFLTGRSVDHVVLERGEVANSWRHERWDSLRLLTPNWLSRLPGFAYDGPDPDGYMTSGEVASFVSDFARVVEAPLSLDTTVTTVRPVDGGYSVLTNQGEWRCQSLVIASGACNIATTPSFRTAVPSSLTQVTPLDYRGPSALPDGGVLVVGASATGVQLAAELQRSGRQVVLSVGEHVRLPRRHRDRDVLWWMDASGVWDQRWDEVDDLSRARKLPSPQLVGTPTHDTLDLNTLTALGVELVGRFAMVRDGEALFSGGLRNVCSLADLKMKRLLTGFDTYAGITDPVQFEPTAVPASTRLKLDLRSGEISTIVWATGFRPDYSWLDVPVVDDKGFLRHEGGVVDAPGLYALGLPMLRRRRSSFLNGIEGDAQAVIDHLVKTLEFSCP